jgi:hypothetical protein
MKNFYNILPKRFQNEKYHNPNFKKHGIKIPFRMLLVGASGSMKTNTLMNLIHEMSGTFNHMVLCIKTADEPLYRFLKDKLGNALTIYEGIDAIPPVQELSNLGQALVIFDDLVNEKKQDIISDYFIRARKIAKGISLCYLTQSYFKTPKIIRIQCNYIVLKKLTSQKDLTMILSDFSLGVDKKRLVELYKYCTNDQLDFLLVDIDAPAEKRFRKNLTEILEP